MRRPPSLYRAFEVSRWSNDSFDLCGCAASAAGADAMVGRLVEDELVFSLPNMRNPPH
jgi:hypothetical protein